MISSTRFFTISQKVFSASTAAVFVIVFAFAASVAAQDSLRDTVYGTPEKKAEKSETPKKKPLPPTTQPTTQPKAQPVRRRTSPPRPQRTSGKKRKTTSLKKLITVTFTAEQPEVEVWLDDEKIGVTDDDLKFSEYLEPGNYTLTAKNSEQDIITTKSITISPEQNSFNISADSNVKNDSAANDRKPSENKAVSGSALGNSNKVKKILENYANPATTDSVTPEDWQFVFQAAQLGQLQGYTAVQIEAQRWFASGQIELAKEEYLNALTAFKKAEEYMPRSALPYYAMGNTYFANERYSDALKLYTQAIQLDREMAMTYKKLGDTYRLLGKEKEAISSYQYAVKFGYGTPETQLWLGTLLLNTKQSEKGLEMLKEVAEKMPSADVYISIGMGYEKLKRDVSAIENYLKAIELDADSAVAYNKLANVYYEQREYRKAKAAFEKVIELDPKGEATDIKQAKKDLREVNSKLR